MNRRYPQRPMVGVGAIIFRGPRVLLIQRGKEPAYGRWSLPGGLVKVGESLHEAVRREVYEEVGLEVEVADVVAVLDRVIYDENGKIEYHYVLLDFRCTSEKGTPSPSSDAMNCAFVSMDELSQYLLTQGTEEVVRRAFGRSQGKSFPIYDSHL